MSRPPRDLLVVGGGPAGLATALHAARRGLDVEVWEPRPGAIDKACGEGLMPGAVAALHALGVDPPGHELLGIRYVAGAQVAEAPFRAGPGRGVRRTTLHRCLLEAGAAAGVPVLERTARDLRQDAAGVTVDGERAAYVVAADGLHSPTRRRLGLDTTTRARSRYGQRRHYRLEPWSAYVEVHWAAAGEAYVTPVADDLVGVAVLSSVRRPYDAHLADFPALREHLAGQAAGQPAGSVRGAGPLRQGARSRVAGRVLLVGDAGGYVDALTGEGIALAVAQAGAAVEAVAAGDPGSYERQWRLLTRRYRWLTQGLVAGTRPALARRAIVPAARRLPLVFGAAVDALARPAEVPATGRRTRQAGQPSG